MIDVASDRRATEFAAVEAYPLVPRLMSSLGLEPSPAFEAQRLGRLRDAIRRALELPFYRDLYAGIDLDPRDLTSVADLESLPVFDVENLRVSIDADPPLGTHQVSRAIARFQFSGGTTGQPRPVAYTFWDRVLADVMHARCLQMHGADETDVVVNSMAYGPHNAAVAFDGAIHRYIGSAVLPLSTGHVTSSRKQVEMMQQYGATHVIASADYLIHLAAVALERGFDLRNDFMLRRFTTIGDASAAEDIWGRAAMSCYGTFDLQMCATECCERSGWHLWEDAYCAWSRDPLTGLPVGNGSPGELIATSLWSEGFPVINMNTRDMTELLPRALCDCGLWVSKLSGFLGRSDSMIKIRGINVWPEAVAPVLSSIVGRHPEYICVATRVGGRDAMTVFAEFEHSGQASTARGALKDHLGIDMDVRHVGPGALNRLTKRDSASKTRRFVDRRSVTELVIRPDGTPE